jgi:hypothetical protein
MGLNNELYEVVDKAQKYDELLKIQGRFDSLVCNFCGKTQHQVKKLIAGPDVYICDECVGLCTEILEEEQQKENQEEEQK